MLKKLSRAGVYMMSVILLAGCIFMVTGCNNPHHPYKDKKNPVIQTDYFKVQIRKEDGYAVILALTDLGKEQEILAIPAEVEGLPVQQIGWQTDMFYGGDGIDFKSAKLKKVYIPHTVIRAYAGFPLTMQEKVLLPIEQRAFWIENSGNHFGGGGGKIFRVSEDAITDRPVLSDSYGWANLYYYYNYENSPNLGYHWFDHITEDNLHLDPENPKRAGYTFTGWYTDPECEAEWDGTKPASEEEEIRLYAGWKEN